MTSRCSSSQSGSDELPSNFSTALGYPKAPAQTYTVCSKLHGRLDAGCFRSGKRRKPFGCCLPSHSSSLRRIWPCPMNCITLMKPRHTLCALPTYSSLTRLPSSVTLRYLLYRSHAALPETEESQCGLARQRVRNHWLLHHLVRFEECRDRHPRVVVPENPGVRGQRPGGGDLCIPRIGPGGVVTNGCGPVGAPIHIGVPQLPARPHVTDITNTARAHVAEMANG